MFETATAQIEQKGQPTREKNGAKRIAKPISWKDFQRKYLAREDGYKYEWLNGTVEKTKRTMDQTQFYILDNILDAFDLFKATFTISGRLIPEGDSFYADHHRRPDIAYFSKGQIHAAATGANQSALFVIEIISNNDVMNRAYGKMKDYEAAGVEVVWLVFPLLKEVHVWNGRHSTVFRGDEICSAAPVLPNFQMVVADIFKLNV